jgi:hypothetical protein
MRWLLALLIGVVALSVAGPAAADPPAALPIEDVFFDVNPCTGDVMAVRFVGTAYIHQHDSRSVVITHRTLTTSDGSVGHGTDTLVDNGQVLMSRVTFIMTNTSGGYRFRARGVFIIDLSTGNVRVDRGFELTCLGP